jgi:hypothetical protein
MINPTIAELLSGVATSLDETVLPELAPGSARNQLIAAIALVRRCAAVGERIGPYLWDDNHDIYAVLCELAPAVGLDAPIARVDAGYPTIDGLRQQNQALQQQLVELLDAVHDAPDDAPPRAVLRALFERMLARESQINTSTWA